VKKILIEGEIGEKAGKCVLAAGDEAKNRAKARESTVRRTTSV